MRKVIDVAKVSFRLGEGRAPESFPFPACMASLMEALGEEKTILHIHAHNRVYEKRPLYDMFLGASGMAFGLLWHDEYCYSALDLMQVTDHNDTIKRAFMWAGWEYDECADANAAKAKIVKSIDAGAPVLVFGLFDTPECAIVCGYDDEDDALIGWSHFQNNDSLEPNGMFRVKNWQGDLWKAILPTQKTARSLTPEHALKTGARIMQNTQTDVYKAGQAAYDVMISEVNALSALDDELRKARYDYIHTVLFSLAEARCYGANFLKHVGAPDVADCFNQIHDLCWKADAVARGEGYKAFEAPEACKAFVNVLCEIRELDKKAAEMLSR